MIIKKNKTFLRIAAWVLSIATVFSVSAFADQSGADVTEKSESVSVINKTFDFSDFLNENKSAFKPDETVVLDYGCAVLFENVTVEKYDGKDNCMVFSGESFANLTFDVKTEGVYDISAVYAPIKSEKSNGSVIALELDGESPYSNLSNVKLCRPWKDAGEMQSDKMGNQIRAEQNEAYAWYENYLYSADGRYNQPLCFKLSSGLHTLKISSENGNFAISKFVLSNSSLKPYSELKSEYKTKQYKETKDISLTYQAEKYSLKSDSTILPDYDKSDAKTQPSSASKMLLNYIPASKYQNPGEWIAWNVDINKSGLYKIKFRVRQQEKSGFTVSRRLYIDNEVPFKECNNIDFVSDNSWYIKTVGDENEDYLFYLEKGSHEIRLEVVPGAFSEISIETDKIIYRLNALYRKALMAVGNTNDTYRDYKLSTVTGIVDEIKALSSLLQEEEQKIIKINGGAGSSLTSIRTLVNLFKVFDKEPDKLATMKDTFKSDIEALSSWNMSVRQQPLDIDYITVCSKNVETEDANAGFFENLWFSIVRFTSTFADDYGTIGDVNDEKNALKVWISTLGRDQLQILKDQVDNGFVKNQKISANISLVSSGINEAVLAGNAPDVALFLTSDQPVNLAIRGALENLNQFDTFDNVKKRFSNGALIPFEYKGNCYGLPLTETYNMMFVRNDVFEEFGLSVPKTWDDLFEVASVLQRNNMYVGIPTTTGMFITLLLQNGGKLYNEKHTATGFDSKIAVNAFIQWTDFFSQYGFPIQYDFYNRFRSGEMPIGIAPFTNYTMLQSAAPEISGLWSMFPVPASVDKDGNYNNTLSICESNGMTVNPGLNQSMNSAVIFSTAENKQNAWKFVDWFTTEESQYEFAMSQEASLGAISRYYTANLNAFSRLPYEKSALEALDLQRKSVVFVNEIPGSYYVARNINSAFRSVVNKGSIPAEILNKYNLLINKELERKSREFG